MRQTEVVPPVVAMSQPVVPVGKNDAVFSCASVAAVPMTLVATPLVSVAQKLSVATLVVVLRCATKPPMKRPLDWPVAAALPVENVRARLVVVKPISPPARMRPLVLARLTEPVA